MRDFAQAFLLLAGLWIAYELGLWVVRRIAALIALVAEEERREQQWKDRG